MKNREENDRNKPAETATIMERYQNIFYRLCDAQTNIEEVDIVERQVNDMRLRTVANLRIAIHRNNSRRLQNYDAGDLRLYARGTTMENCKNKQPLKIDVSLDDPKIQGTSLQDPLLVVVSASPPLPAANHANDVPQLALSQSTQLGLELMAKDFLARNATISISNATTEKASSLMGKMGLSLKGATWQNKPPLQPVGGFVWQEGDEDSAVNREAYMLYLKTTLQVPQNYALADVRPQRSLLSIDGDDGMVENFRLKGSTDVVIAKSEHVENNAMKNNIEALLELKKQTNISKKDHTPQTICEHFAASYLNPKLPVVSVLTDLNEKWTFFWFAFDGDDDSDLALYKLCLVGKNAAANATYLLDSLFDTAVDANLPNTFAKRQPFRAVRDFLARRKKRRRAFDGDYSDSRDRNCKPPSRGADQSPVNDSSAGPCANPSPRSDRPSQNNKDGECRGGERSMSMADSLSLFAPPASRDVGNELDLLDMVGESEQYEIVRSFAARHIVPYMQSSSEV